MKIHTCYSTLKILMFLGNDNDWSLEMELTKSSETSSLSANKPHTVAKPKKYHSNDSES
jgi:hypothetical protein